MFVLLLVFFVLLVLFSGCERNTSEPTSSHDTEREEVDEIPGVPFGWPFKDRNSFKPRGGTSTGAPVTLAEAPLESWTKLREKNISKRERDRRAILAMTGSYRVSFQFLETMGFTDGYEPPRPYFSWATEHIEVLTNEKEFIQLQHTLVMYFEGENGQVNGPKVMKHWRQDWRYEDRDVLVYQGDRTWKRKRLSPERVEGRWTQAVYQVDDAPRYEAVGRWRHQNKFSSWTSASFRRPLPRREFSVRDDYDMLVGTNQITITPTGWVHEQNNRKVRRTEGNGEDSTVLAKEYGINRYERINEPDLKNPADSYWKRAGSFWRTVRVEWREILDEADHFRLKENVEGKSLHEHLFEYASNISKPDNYNAESGGQFVQNLLEKYVQQPNN